MDMRTFLVIFLISFFLLLIFLFARNLEISKIGKFVSSTDVKPSNEKWRVVVRIEILNGKIVNVTKNLIEVK
ncbi:MAG: hypothetical protein QXU74_04025 [Candidatus Aenigmatarchaeota archaeon]